MLDALHHQLRDPVTPAQLDRVPKVVVDQADLDLATVTGVDGPRGVYDAEPDPRGEAGPRVDEGGVPVGQGDRDAGADDRTLARRDHHVGRRDEVGAGVTGPRIRRNGDSGIEPGQQDLDAGHDRRDYPGSVTDTEASTGTTYRERLYVTWYWWLLP